MSTEQISGKGATIANPNPQNEQSVVFTTAQSVSPSLAVVNARVDATISNLFADYVGYEIPQDAFHALGLHIKSIFAQSLSGGSASVDTPTPLFVQMPDFLVEWVSDPEKLYSIRRTLEEMEKTAVRNSEPCQDSIKFESVASTFQSILTAAEHTLQGRQLGFDPTVAVAPPVEPEQPANQTKAASQKEFNRPGSKMILKADLSLSVSKNHPKSLSELQLVNLALRKLQYDHTRKLTFYLSEEWSKDAAHIAYELRVVDGILGRLFDVTANSVNELNNVLLDASGEALNVAYSGFEDNIQQELQEFYLDYNDDALKPGV